MQKGFVSYVITFMEVKTEKLKNMYVAMIFFYIFVCFFLV